MILYIDIDIYQTEFNMSAQARPWEGNVKKLLHSEIYRHVTFEIDNTGLIFIEIPESLNMITRVKSRKKPQNVYLYTADFEFDDWIPLNDRSGRGAGPQGMYVTYKLNDTLEHQVALAHKVIDFLYSNYGDNYVRING
jgi:hypothetical protein